MKNIDTSILESKLKRHKISYSNNNGVIVIGKPKIDYITLIGLIIIPIAFAVVIGIFLLQNNNDIVRLNRGKFVVAIVFFFGTGYFNLSRLKSKKNSNNNLKIIHNKSIKIKNDFGENIFNSKNINDFEYIVKKVDEGVYEGNLYLIDKNEQRHQILGFDDDSEKYALNDLKWFAEYFIKQIGIQMIVSDKNN